MASSLATHRRAASEASTPPGAGHAYPGYVLGLLVAVGICGWVDRNVFAVLLESVKSDLALSDTELGLLGGAAFGLFYATVGLPVAWLADRCNRRSLIAAALGLWSVMTALCGLATGFATLFACRVGVGVGEAGGAPPSQSLVADYFPPERRAFALGILYLYVPLGFLVGFASGGWLDQALGWRQAFVFVGLPGVVLALLVRLTLREPPRGQSERLHVCGAGPALGATLRYFWSRRSLRHLPVAGAVHGIGAFAAAVWLPSFLIRVHDMSSGEAGAWMAGAYGLGGGLGVIVGGYLADRLAARSGDARWHAWGAALVIVLAVPFAAIVYSADSAAVALAALVAATLLGHMFLGPVMAMMQNLAGLRRRAVVAAFYLFLVNLVSMGVGPVAVGVASDRFGATLGHDALRYALLAIVVTTSLWAAGHFLAAARSLRGDLEAARLGDRQAG